MRRPFRLVPLLALAGCVVVGVAEECPTGQVRFTPDGGGVPDDLTTTFESTGATTPANYTLDRAGTLSFCGGTYYALITVRADDATIRGFEADKAVLSGAGASRIVHHTGAGTLTLTDLVFEHGSAEDGGAVLSDAGDLTAEGCDFDQNAASHRGGAVAVLNGSVGATGSTFTNNEAAGAGGALYVAGGGTTGSSGTVDLTDTVFEGNQAIRDEGGAAYFTTTAVTCTRTSGRGGFYRNAPGVAFLGLGRELVSDGCDWGEGDEDNSGYDLRLVDSRGGTTDETFGDDASFTCEDTGCTP